MLHLSLLRNPRKYAPNFHNLFLRLLTTENVEKSVVQTGSFKKIRVLRFLMVFVFSPVLKDSEGRYGDWWFWEAIRISDVLTNHYIMASGFCNQPIFPFPESPHSMAHIYRISVLENLSIQYIFSRMDCLKLWNQVYHSMEWIERDFISLFQRLLWLHDFSTYSFQNRLDGMPWSLPNLSYRLSLHRAILERTVNATSLFVNNVTPLL